MATNPLYSPPPPIRIQSFLTGEPSRAASDHNKVTAVHAIRNAMPTQGGLPVTIRLNLSPEVNRAVYSVLSDPTLNLSQATAAPNSIATPATPRRIIRLQIKDIVLPMVANSALRIFINNPNAQPDTSDEDPHHVRNVVYFCCGGRSGSHPCFVFDVTPTMKRLQEKGLLDLNDGLTVQVLAVPITPGTAVPAVIPGTLVLTVASL